MSVTLDATQTANYTEARAVFDAWFDAAPRGFDREAGWVRLVAALDTETGCRILAHTGEWHGGGEINQAQKDLLRASAVMYLQATGRQPDGFGSNGGSVGALQQIPTPVAMAADRPWGGWGTVVDCMVLATSIPKFLAQLGVTTDPFYQGKRTSDPVVADLLRVQQPLASEVAANYGAAIVARAREIAARFPRAAEKDWLTMATTAEVKTAFGDALESKDVATGSEVAALRKDIAALSAKIDKLPAAVWGLQLTDTVPVAAGAKPRVIAAKSWLQEARRVVEYINARTTDTAKDMDALTAKVDKLTPAPAPATPAAP